MNLLNFNSNNKSWKVYTNTLTSIANDDLLIKPNNTNDLILEVSANNNIILKRGDISYSINTKFDTIDTSFNDVYSKFTTIDSSFNQVNTKFFIIDASFNNKLASISGSIVPLNDICYNLGSDTNRWANAYIRDISVTNISASGNIVPLFDLSGSLGTNTRQWANAYIRDLNGLVNINGQPYGSGSGSGTIDLTNVTPSIDNSGSLGIASRSWENAYIRDLSVTYIDVSVNCNPLNNNTGTLGDPNFRIYTYSLNTTPLSWSDHKAQAETVPNRYLAAILNAEDNIKATALITGETWIGGRRRSGSTNATDRTSLTWYWDTGEPWNYHNWESTQPNLTTELAVRIHPGGVWHDHNPTSVNTAPALYMTYSFTTKRWGNAYIRDLSVGSIDISVNCNPLTNNSGSLGAFNKIWGNAYIRDLSVSNISASGNIIPLFTLSGSLGTNSNRWNIAYIKDISNVVNINGEPYEYMSNINIQNITTNIIPLMDASGSLGIISKQWGNAYIRDLSASSIDVSVNCNPLRDNSGSLGIVNKLWSNAYVTDMSVNSINVDFNISPLNNNSGNLGIVNDRWGNAYINNLDLSGIDVTSPNDTTSTSFKIGNFLTGYFPTTTNTRPVIVDICNQSTYSSVDNFGLQVINPNGEANNWSAINVEVRNTTNSTNKAGIQLSVRGNNLVGRNIWNIYCRATDATNRLIFYTTATGTNNFFNAMSGTNEITASINSAGTFFPTSDDRLKHNEIIINNGLTIIDQLVPKFYQKTQVMLDANYNGDLSGYAWSYEAGLIAQEVLQIDDISFAVSGGDTYDSSNNVIRENYMLAYNHIFVYGLAAIKELDTKVIAQESSILSLQTNILSQETTILNQQTIINNLIASIEALENKV